MAEKGGKVRKRATLQDVARAAADAGVEEGLAARLIASLHEKGPAGQEEEEKEEDEIDDHFADGKKNEEAGASAAASSDGVAERLRILEAKADVMNEAIREISIESCRNTMRVSTKVRVPPRELATRLKPLLDVIRGQGDIIMIKRGSHYFDFVFREIQDFRAATTKLRDQIRAAGLDKVVYLSPPPAPDSNPMRSIPYAVFKCLVNLYDMSADAPLARESKPRTTRPVCEAKRPEFSLELPGGKTVLSAQFDLENMECRMKIVEKIVMQGATLKATDFVTEIKTHVRSAFRIRITIVGTDVTLLRAPDFKAVREAKALRR